MKLKAIKETRYINLSDKALNIRAAQDDKGQKYIEGYASRFNHESKLLVEYHHGEFREFTEIILPGAFDEVLRSNNLNVIHTIDHDRSKMLARTISKTLELSVDDIGLKYRFAVPNTTLGNDFHEMVARGDYYESSFTFTVDSDGEKWTEGEIPKREISKISGLYDTSSCIDGAYSNTPVTIARNLKELVEPVVQDRSKDKLDIDIFILENE